MDCSGGARCPAGPAFGRRRAGAIPRRSANSNGAGLLLAACWAACGCSWELNCIWCFIPHSVFSKSTAKALRARCNLPAHRVGRLAGQRADLFIAQFLVAHQQQQQPVFGRQPSSASGCAGPVPWFRGRARANRSWRARFPRARRRVGQDMPVVPGCAQFLQWLMAMR